MGDLVAGRYPQFNPLWRALGMPQSVLQSDIPPRTNLEFLGVSTMVDSATAATKKGVIACIPVNYGDWISKVSVLVGATAGKTAMFSFTCLYSGTTEKTEAKLLAQSKVKETEIKASELWTQELEKPVCITAENAPNGYVFAGLVVEATTIETLCAVNVPTALQKVWFKGGPEVLACETTQKAKGEAALTTKTETAVEKVPIVFLT